MQPAQGTGVLGVEAGIGQSCADAIEALAIAIKLHRNNFKRNQFTLLSPIRISRMKTTPILANRQIDFC
jgi:hypothetical protein